MFKAPKKRSRLEKTGKSFSLSLSGGVYVLIKFSINLFFGDDFFFIFLLAKLCSPLLGSESEDQLSTLSCHYDNNEPFLCLSNEKVSMQCSLGWSSEEQRKKAIYVLINEVLNAVQ